MGFLFFSLGKIGQENLFHHILERKEALSRLYKQKLLNF